MTLEQAQQKLSEALARIEEQAAEKEAYLSAKDEVHAIELAENKAELTATQQALADLTAYKDAMVAQVSAVLQSDDPEQYKALAVAFLTPVEEKARAEKAAKREALLAEAAKIAEELETPTE